MITDIVSFVLWYVLISILGLVAFPILYRLLPALPGRGYAFSRTFGWLLWGYVFWLLTSLGFLTNSSGGLLTAFILLLVLSGWAFRSVGWDEIKTWFVRHRIYVFFVEWLFLLAFAGWTIVRAVNPEIFGTEKPMELAFINAIMHSPTFPPHDPWLSGYAISYYYFGYVLVAMLAEVSNTAAGVAFNLGLALVFALSAIGGYGVVYNLLKRGRECRGSDSPSVRNEADGWLGLLGPLFLLIVSNFEGVLEVLHARGLFWQKTSDGTMVSKFWTWLDMKELSLPPSQPFGWIPTRHWWWWRGSRVVQDYDFAGVWREVIDEFPFFSYLLGDLHPHVLAMPFGLLAIALAINLYFGGGQGETGWRKWWIPLNLQSFLFGGLVLGSLFTLNAWDFPIYLALFAGTFVLQRSGYAGWSWWRLREFLGLVLALGVLGGLIYLPFYLGFSSQAGGILPNLLNPTRGVHLWVMFGTLLIPIGIYLLYVVRQMNWKIMLCAMGLGLLLVVGLWFFSLMLGWAITRLPVLGELFLDHLGAGEAGALALFVEAIRRRLATPAGWLTLAFFLSLAISGLWPQEKVETSGKNTVHIHPNVFVTGMVLLGTVVTLIPEFIYLRDQFGTRMNTIFKFYYQSWLMWSCAAAYGTAILLREVKGGWGLVYRLVIVLVLVSGMVYPTMGLVTKTNGFQPSVGWTLDGTLNSGLLTAEDRMAVEWLQTVPAGVIVEAVGNSYSQYGRIATHSGLPSVLNWPGHEVQWRGSADELGSRQSDIMQLYSTNDWGATRDLLERYDIRYVYVGALERRTYSVNETKFQRYMELVFQMGQTKIYAWSTELGSEP
ncbi:MAG: DUF2298 domain-containing protein [Chloroflexota bacterium]